MNRKVGLVLGIITSVIALSLIAYLVLASVAVLVPMTEGRYSDTIRFNCTIADGDAPINATNVTILYGYGAAGANASTVLVVIANYSVNATSFSTVVNISGLPDATTYNFTCMFLNGTPDRQVYKSVANITIDNTPPIVTTLSPVPNGNYSGVLNITTIVTDTALGLTSNKSVFFNITNITVAGNFSFINASNITAGGSYFNYSLTTNTSYYPDGTYALHIYANDTASNATGGMRTNLNSATNFTFIIDNTIPDSNSTDFSGIVANGNYSGSITINISVHDLTAGINSVYFNITNKTAAGLLGKQVGFLKATLTGAGYRYSLNASGNTSYPDGVYNITAYVNDSAGNVNNSAKIQIKIDNTGPVLTYTCDTYAPILGETVTCGCSGTDSATGNASYPDGSGENASTISYTASPPTTETGTTDYTCTESDYAGATSTASVTITVEGNYNPSGTGGAGGGESYWTSTTAVSSEQFTAGYTRQLSSKQRVSVKVNSTDHFVGVTALTSTTATINVSSTPQQKTMSVGEEWKVEVTGDTYYDLSAKLNSIANNKASLTVKSIHEAGATPTAPPGEEEGATAGEGAGAAAATAAKSLLSSVWFWVIVVIVIIAVIAFVVLRKKQ